jgi:hypothetical protein
MSSETNVEFKGTDGDIFRKIEHFITPSVRTLNTTVNYLFYLFDPFMHLTRET